jgi:hypothetical protein
MNNQEVYEFINSKDIRKYLRDIDYQFSVSEYAYLIWQSRNHTIRQKHKAFTNLLNTTDTCIIRTTCCREGWDLHQTIKEYIELEDHLIQKFLEKEPSCFYVGEWTENNSYDWYGDNHLFAECNDAYSFAVDGATEAQTQWFRVQKRYIDNSKDCSTIIEARYSPEGEMISIDFVGNFPLSEHESALLFERFDDMWFDIPIPFRPGDIVCDCFDGTPFVITTTVPWYRKEHPNKRSSNNIHLTHMDMTASGYSVDEEAMSVKYNWLSFHYLNLDYYNDELSGMNRILKTYSLFKKGIINGDTLTKLSQLIMAEQFARKIYRDIDWMMDDSTRKQLGLDKYQEKKL